ncbi:MAG: hypothetical protein NTV65_04720 [Proteobacteria bacterium]|jgi:hypothetical protein|nr:hypothetical protein [Pseudomonadota bacterium]
MSDSSNSTIPKWVESLLSAPLTLPEGGDFHSVPAKLDLAAIIALSETYLPFINSRPDFFELKKEKARACYGPFIL